MSGAITGTTLAIMGGIGAAGALGGAAISAHAAGKAADAQSTAAMNSAQLQYKASQDALGFQKQQYATSQQQMQPWLQSGQGALSNLNYLMGIGGQPNAVQGQMGGIGPGMGAARPVGPAGGGMNGMGLPQMPGYASPVNAGMGGAPGANWNTMQWNPGGNSMPGAASPVNAGMGGVPSGIPGSASPISTGMGGAPAQLNALRAMRTAGIPATASPVSTGINGLPSSGISGTGNAVSAGMAGIPAPGSIPAASSPVSAGMGGIAADGSRLQGIGAVRGGGIPATGGPVSAGMGGISAAPGLQGQGSANPVSVGMGSVGTGMPGSASPISTGMAGVPGGGNQLQGIGSVHAGIPASTSPMSTGLGVSNPGIAANAGIPYNSPQPPSTGMGGDTGYQPNQANGGYGSLMQPWTQQFQAPTNLTEQLDPGYQARLALGTDALQRSAAARGNLLTGGTAKALDTYAQDYASNEYGNVYNRAFNQYAQNYNQFQNNQANQYNRLASMAGMGQQTANQLGLLGSQAAQGVSNNLLNTAGMMGQDYQNAGAANASGYAAAGNAYGSALGGIGGNLTQLMMLKQLYGGTNYTGGGNPGNELTGLR